MPVLNDADDVRVGTVGADAVYAGADLVWSPGGGGLPVTDGLSIWLDPSDPATLDETGTPGFVSKWIDKSPNGYDQDVLAGREPPVSGSEIGGLNALDFTPNNTNMSSSNTPVNNPVDGSWTSFGVVQHGNATTADLFKANAPYPFSATFVRTFTNNRGQAVANDSLSTITANSNDNALQSDVPFLMSSMRSVDQLQAWIDGDSAGPSSGGDQSYAADAALGLGGWVGLVGELIVYSRALSPAEFNAMEDYMNTKWGLPA